MKTKKNRKTQKNNRVRKYTRKNNRVRKYTRKNNRVRKYTRKNNSIRKYTRKNNRVRKYTRKNKLGGSRPTVDNLQRAFSEFLELISNLLNAISKLKLLKVMLIGEGCDPNIIMLLFTDKFDLIDIIEEEHKTLHKYLEENLTLLRDREKQILFFKKQYDLLSDFISKRLEKLIYYVFYLQENSKKFQDDQFFKNLLISDKNFRECFKNVFKNMTWPSLWMSFQDMIMRPIQTLMRYPMLLQEIVRITNALINDKQIKVEIQEYVDDLEKKRSGLHEEIKNGLSFTSAQLPSFDEKPIPSIVLSYPSPPQGGTNWIENMLSGFGRIVRPAARMAIVKATGVEIENLVEQETNVTKLTIDYDLDETSLNVIFKHGHITGQTDVWTLPYEPEPEPDELERDPETSNIKLSVRNKLGQLEILLNMEDGESVKASASINAIGFGKREYNISYEGPTPEQFNKMFVKTVFSQPFAGSLLGGPDDDEEATLETRERSNTLIPGSDSTPPQQGSPFPVSDVESPQSVEPSSGGGYIKKRKYKKRKYKKRSQRSKKR